MARNTASSKDIDQEVAIDLEDALELELAKEETPGGLDIAAMAGAILACRFARTPVLIDGIEGLAAALVLRALEPTAIRHCLLAHASADPLAAALGRALGLDPLLDLGISTGDGVASATALSVLRAACACQIAAGDRN